MDKKNNSKNKEDIFAEELLSGAISGSEQQINAIDLANMYQEIELALEYVRGSRSDMETATPASFVNECYNAIDETGKLIKKMEVLHETELQEWTDETGGKQFVLLREQDPEQFDAVVAFYIKANTLFGEYVRTHIDLIETGKI